MPQKTKSQVLRKTTLDYLNGLSAGKDVLTIESELLAKTQEAFELENTQKPPKMRWPIPQSLSFSQIADILAALYPICRINCTKSNMDESYDLLAVYQTSGENRGIYVTNEEEFRRLARQFDYNLTKQNFQEVMEALKDKVPRKVRCSDRDLIAVNNGIFNYKTKKLLPFDPEYVFITKSHVDYNDKAKNVCIHNKTDGTDWDVESWMAGLSDDPDVVNLLWEILGAIIRPGVRWNKAAWFYSSSGNNGKGTLCELMRSLCGEGSHTSIPIADFGKDFMLEPLTRAQAIIVDENDVGTFIDRAANLKAVITNDVIYINRKFKSPIAYQFYGFMVQCLNEMPKVKDRSDSFYRRQIFISFEKCFTGQERKYIKNDYLHRKEVLEYVLYRVLHMDYYELSEPEACKETLLEYKEYNDTVQQFYNEFKDAFTWPLLPYVFLYDLYKAWCKETSPSGSILGRNVFITDILNVSSRDTMFTGDRQTKRWVPNEMRNTPEPLIKEYDLKNWMNPTCRDPDDTDILCCPVLKENYRGLMRI